MFFPWHGTLARPCVFYYHAGMKEPGKQYSRPAPVRQPVLLGLFTGTALGAGYLLSGVPNVELISLIVALGGAVLGPMAGLLCGLLTGAIFALANPLGMSPPLLAAGQSAGMGCLALCGWLAARSLGPEVAGVSWLHRLIGLAAGLFGTLVYDLLTVTASWALFPDLPLKVVLVKASSFVLLHTGINAAIFFVLFAPLARRLQGLARTSLVGGQMVLILLISGFVAGQAAAQPDKPVRRSRVAPADSLLATLPDSLQAVPADSAAGPREAGSPPGGPDSWQRPLWDPFSGSLVRHLDRRTSWVVVSDGGLGASTYILGEASTSYMPTILRNGLPDGTGHRLTDDPWLAGNQMLSVSSRSSGFLAAGTGAVDLTARDPLPGKAISQFRGIKGPHESYMRGISLLTPRTAWRLGFDFEENIDRLGYNWTNQPDENFAGEEEPRGNSSIRVGRTHLVRRMGPDSSLHVEYHTERKTRNELLVLDAEVQEIWGDGVRLDARDRLGDWDLRTALYWNNRTVEWGPLARTDSARRKIETGREGILLDLSHARRDTGALEAAEDSLGYSRPPESRLQVLISRWDVLDNGAPAEGAPLVEPSGSRATAQVQAAHTRDTRLGRIQAGATGDFLEQAGWQPGAFVQWNQRRADPDWRLRLERAGRAPRSDELLTSLTHHVASRELALLPDPDLQHESLLRASLLLKTRLLGFDLALDGAMRRLRDGITWVAATPGGLSGTWRNALDMNSTRVTGAIAREGRLAGFARARLEGTWQTFDEITNRAAFLPPEQYLRLELLWEQHFFQEDGILQLALLTTRRGEMQDPWDPTGGVVLPAATTSDLLVGFRLVGTHLSLNFRNVTGQRTRLSSGALSPGMEMDMRLNWTFLY